MMNFISAKLNYTKSHYEPWTWNPIWNIRLGLNEIDGRSLITVLYGWISTVRDLSSTILNGLRSCMLEEWKSPIWTRMVGYSGSSQADSPTKKKLARESGMFNLKKCPIFMELFPGQRYNDLFIYFKCVILELASEIIDKMERDRAR